MVLAQYRILHPHHVSIRIHSVDLRVGQRRSEILGPLELDVRRLGQRLHVELGRVAVDDPLRGEALHVELFELV